MAADNPLWTYSAEVYAKPGVEAACLRLQDRFGVDVNVLFYCCLAAHRYGVALNGAAIKDVLRCVDRWNADVVRPLRALRRTLKGATFEGIDPDEKERFRDEIKRVELLAEKQQQAALCALIELPKLQPGDSDGRRRMALRNLRAYLDTLGAATDAQAQEDVRLIAAALFDRE